MSHWQVTGVRVRTVRKAGSMQWLWAFLVSAFSPGSGLDCKIEVNAGKGIITEWGFAALFLHLLCGFGFVSFPSGTGR